MKCLITGCELVSPQEGWSMHGDLFEVGDAYVFNAVLAYEDNYAEEQLKGEALRTYNRKVPDALKALYIQSNFTQPYFERRGVLVVAKKDASLNQAAQDYLK